MGIKKRLEMKLLPIFFCGLGSAAANPAKYTREQAMQALKIQTWKATDQVYNWIKSNYDGYYQDGLAQVDEHAVKVAFKFNDENGDGKVSKEELLSAIRKTESDIRFITNTDFINEYEKKYWDFVDRNNDDLLNYDEFKATWSDFAAIQAQMNLNLYDKNHNYQLDSDEIAKMMSDAEKFYSLMGIYFTESERSDIGKIHSATETDEKPESRSWMEQINFILKHYSYLIQKI